MNGCDETAWAQQTSKILRTTNQNTSRPVLPGRQVHCTHLALHLHRLLQVSSKILYTHSIHSLIMGCVIVAKEFQEAKLPELRSLIKNKARSLFLVAAIIASCHHIFFRQKSSLSQRANGVTSHLCLMGCITFMRDACSMFKLTEILVISSCV